MKAASSVVVLVLSLSPYAQADATSVGDEHARLAKANAAAGHLDEAITEFDLAFRANPLPKYIFNKALLEQRRAEANAGHVEDMRRSVDDFTRYLALDPKASDRREVLATIDGLKAKIESAEAAARETTVPAKAEGTINRDATSPTPLAPAAAPVSTARRSGGIGLVVAGVVLGAAGGALWAYGGSVGSDASSATTLDERENRLDTAGTFSLAGPVLLGVGAVAAVTGVVLLALPRGEKAKTALWVAPRGNRLVVGGTW